MLKVIVIDTVRNYVYKYMHCHSCLILFRLFGIGIVLYRVQRSSLAVACYTDHSCSNYVFSYFPGWLYHIYLYEGMYFTCKIDVNF